MEAGDHSTRRRVLAGEELARLAADISGLGQRAFALLEHGLGDYATRPARPTRDLEDLAAPRSGGLAPAG